MVSNSKQSASVPPIVGKASTLDRPTLPSFDRYIDVSSARSRGIPAWLLSAFLHFFFIIVLAIIVQPTPRGTSTEADRKGGIVLVKRTPRTTEYFDDSKENPVESSPSAAAAAIRKALPTLNDLDEQLPSFLPTDDDIGKIGAELGDDLKGADGFLDGIGTGNRQAKLNNVTTEVFGLKGTGTKFVYVFDRSGSMEGFGGRPLLAAKAQLISSIESLGPKQQFQIIFYNERPRAFTPDGGRPKLMFANEENKRSARKFVAGISGGGATEHLPALKMAVDFGPDVVFFLTDAEDPVISPEQLDVVDRWNRNAASINSIEFGASAASDADNFLIQLAKRNGGQYVYKNVTRFPAKR